MCQLAPCAYIKPIHEAILMSSNIIERNIEPTVYNVFKKFKARVEKQSGYDIKAMRSNRGDEFTLNKFNKFCVKKMKFTDL